MICPKVDKNFEAAQKLYKNDITLMTQDYMSNGNQWSKKVREAAGETILEDISLEEPAGNPKNFINLSTEKRKSILTNIDLQKQRFEYLLQRDPDNESLGKRVAYLKSMVKDALIISDELLVLDYIKYSEVSLRKAKEVLKELEQNTEEEDLYKVMRVVSELEALEVLKDVEVEFSDTEEGKEATKVYKDLLESREVIYKKSLDFARGILANKLANNSNNTVYVKYRDKFDKKFTELNKNNAFENRQAKADARQDYIEEQLAENAEHIQMESSVYYANYVKNIASDVSSLEYFAPNTFINESLFSMIVNEILIDLEVAKSEAEAESLPMEQLFDEVSREVSGNTAFELWQDILIKDSNGWRLLEPAAKNKYLRKQADKANGISTAPFTAEELKWAEVLKKPALERSYNKFVDMLNKSDFNFTSTGKLGLYIPTLQADVYKKITQQGATGVLSSIKEFGKINEKFQDLIGSDVTAFTRMDDKVTMGVPVYMRASDVKDELRNFDLPTLMMMNLYNSKVFAARLKNKELIDAAMFTVAGSRVAYSGFNSVKTKVLNQNGNTSYQEDSSQSNLYKRLQDLKESMIFGQGMKAGKTLINITQKANMISSMINLSGNVIAAASSFGNNLFQNIEARISDSVDISRKAAAKGRSKYFKYMSGQIKDYAEQKTPKSFLGHLYNFYNPGMETFAVKFESDYKSLLSRHANMSTLFVAQKASDTPAYSMVMISYLESTFATNEKGELLNSEGEVVSQKKDAMTLMEAYEMEFKESGTMGLPKFVKGNNRTGENTTKNLKKLARAIQNFSSERFGAYGSLNKAAAGRTALGSLFYSQRGFLVPILMQKFKGISKVTDKRYLYDIPMEDRHIDETRGITTEGTYVIGTKVILDMVRNTVKAGGLLKSRSDVMSKLGSRDLAQFRRMQVEVALLTSLYIIASSLRSAGEDDDDDLKLMAAFYTRRIYSELRSPSSPKEFLRLFQQPTVSSGTLERILKLGRTAMEDIYNGELSKYKTGPYKDDMKLKRGVIKLTPVLNQINRNYDWKRMYDYLEKM